MSSLQPHTLEVITGDVRLYLKHLAQCLSRQSQEIHSEINRLFPDRMVIDLPFVILKKNFFFFLFG